MTKQKLLVAVLVCLAYQPSLAVDLWCSGTVPTVYVDDQGRLYIHGTWHPSYTIVCDIDSSWNGISIETCRSWFAMLQAANHTAGMVTVNYRNVPHATCADLPDYIASPPPEYVMNKDG